MTIKARRHLVKTILSGLSVDDPVQYTPFEGQFKNIGNALLELGAIRRVGDGKAIGSYDYYLTSSGQAIYQAFIKLDN
jgi:hypothetical protein